ncbi:hypothetical protein JTE90_001667 [Oedothorax gibbosus]|uniref:Uncharacterized protein n=1 Tax=Oedothorax gibbosus TaxID=931172 RepID=A0AAV6UTU2_9ARAC|nr:hypothetical protein JTE90_001667 [Oedothorax gibbosus]
MPPRIHTNRCKQKQRMGNQEIYEEKNIYTQKEEISYKRFTMKTVLIIIVLVFILASQVECKKNTLDCSLVKVKCKVPECDNPIYDTSVSCCQFCPGDHGTNG